MKIISAIFTLAAVVIFNIIYLPIAWILFAIGFVAQELWGNLEYGWNKSKLGYLHVKLKVLRDKYSETEKGKE